MNKIIILVTNPDTYSTKCLLESLRVRGINTVLANSLSGTQIPARAGDIIIHRDTGILSQNSDLKIIEKLSDDQIICPPIKTTKLLRTKWSQFKFCLLKKIPFVPTIKVDGLPTFNEFKKKCLQISQSEWVIKMNHSNQGIGCIHITKIETLYDIWETFYYMGDTDFVIQALQGGREKRAYFLGDKVILTLSKNKKDSFKSNRRHSQDWSLGENLSEAALNKIEALVKLFNPWDFWCFDYFDQTDGFSILDINLVPGHEMFDLNSSQKASDLVSYAINMP